VEGKDPRESLQLYPPTTEIIETARFSIEVRAAHIWRGSTTRSWVAARSLVYPQLSVTRGLNSEQGTYVNELFSARPSVDGVGRELAAFQRLDT